jgi:hypothetical protein
MRNQHLTPYRTHTILMHIGGRLAVAEHNGVNAMLYINVNVIAYPSGLYAVALGDRAYVPGFASKVAAVAWARDAAINVFGRVARFADVRA